MAEPMFLDPAANGPMIRCEDLLKIYRLEDAEVLALRGLHLHVERGEMVGVVGASGSGKSTLLGVLAGLVRADAGVAQVNGQPLSVLESVELDHYRRDVIGVVWQQSSQNLAPHLTAAQNVAMSPVYRGDLEPRARARELLELVGLGDRADHYPRQLSGGQRVRAALAVALASKPQLLLADEPTGELDSQTSTEIFQLLKRLNQELGLTQLIVSHDPTIDQHVGRVLEIRDGQFGMERRTTSTLLWSDAAQAVPAERPAERFLLMDRTGRLQLETDHAELLGGGGRVMARSDGPNVVLSPVETAKGVEQDPKSGASEPNRIGHLSAARDLSGAQTAVDLKAVCRIYSGAGDVHALRGLDLSVPAGTFLALRGRSGSGKTTLLNVIGGLDAPTSGNVEVLGTDLGSLKKEELAAWRRRNLAFLLQPTGLLPFLSAEENVDLGLRISGTPRAERTQRVAESLEQVGLSEYNRHRPGELSGGQQQRVGLARALAARSRLLIADEPTDQLDRQSADQVLGLMGQMAMQYGTTILMATHDREADHFVHEVVNITDGKI